jgi:hypothetical protein
MEDETLQISCDKLNNFKNYEIYEAKFSLMTRVQKNAFEKEKYKPEGKIIVKNEKGQSEEKDIPLNNYIRWRNRNKSESEDKDENHLIRKELEDFKLLGFHTTNKTNLIQSNAKLVEWSDGTMQLVVGEDYFDINLSNMDNVRLGLQDNQRDQSETFVINKPVKQRMLFTPSEHCNMRKVEVLAQNENERKVKLAYSYYDKQSYNKEEFEKNRFNKKKPQSNKDNQLTKALNKKRKRSGLSD